MPENIDHTHFLPGTEPLPDISDLYPGSRALDAYSHTIDSDGAEHLESVDYPSELAIERYEDTPIGPVTIIAQDTDFAPYDLEDFSELLAEHDPTQFERVIDETWRSLSYTPDGEAVLRWNISGRKSVPQDYNGIVEHMSTYYSQVDRLRALGLPMLRRNVYLVEYDQYHKDRPVLYTVAPRLADGTPLSSNRQGELITTNIDTHLQACTKVTDYLINTPAGEPYIHDSLAGPWQFAADGTWLDYDPNIQTLDGMKAYQLRLMAEWAGRLPASSARQELLDKIEATPWRNADRMPNW